MSKELFTGTRDEFYKELTELLTKHKVDIYVNQDGNIGIAFELGQVDTESDILDGDDLRWLIDRDGVNYNDNVIIGELLE